MNTSALIDLAKKHSGMTLGEMAKELGIRQERISEWKKGTFKPEAGELAYFAEKAELPILETVAEIEEQFDPRFAHIWAKALGNLRAAGVAASLNLAPVTLVTMTIIDAANRITSLYFSLGHRAHRPRFSTL